MASVMIGVAMVVAGCRKKEKAIKIDEAYEALVKIKDGMMVVPENVRLAVLEGAYVDLFGVARAKRGAGLRDRELGVWFEAASMVAAMTDKVRFAREAEEVLGELARRKVATAENYEEMYGVDVEVRRFDEARALAARHPSAKMEALPVIRAAANLASGAPTELVVDAHEAAVTRQAVELSTPAQIVVIGHPDCHFTSNAATAIEADPVLRDVFRGHAKWIAPPMMKFLLADVQRWNRERPELPMSMAFRRDEWPSLDRWAMPTFYFLQHGQVIGEVHGWPKAGHRDELVANAKAIGLL